MSRKKKLEASLLISFGILLITAFAVSGSYRSCGEQTLYTFSLFGQKIIEGSRDAYPLCVGGGGSDWQGFPLPVKEQVLVDNPAIQDSVEGFSYNLLGITSNLLIYFLISYGVIELIAHSRKSTAG